MGGLHGKYPVVLTQSVLWGDMDAFQHVNNTAYFRYFEDARIAYFDQLRCIQYKDRTQIGPILASARCDFRAPLSYPDTIQIATTVEDIQARRFVMKYIIYSKGLERLAAEGEGLIVYFDYARGRSCEIPGEILSGIAKLQGECSG